MGKMPMLLTGKMPVLRKNMISNPFTILAALLGIEALVLIVSEGPRTAGWFKYVPPMFWIYFLPMLANTFGLLPSESPIYSALSRYVLSASLVLLLLAVDLRAIVRLGPVALAVMLAGSLGIMIGGPAVYLIFRQWLPNPQSWMGFGSLSASWIGGSANMLAVKEAIGAPIEVFQPMLVVDTVIPYAWMTVMLLLAGKQAAFDRWNRSKLELVEELSRRAAMRVVQPKPLSATGLGMMLAVSVSVGLACLAVGTWMPRWLAMVPTWLASAHVHVDGKFWTDLSKYLGPMAWTIILASTAGLVLSFTPARRLEAHGSTKLGYILLYLVLTGISAQANLLHLREAGLLLLAGVLWVMIHVAFTLAAGRLLRAPMGLLAAASQANVGGPASAPVVAATYHPALAPVGLLLAVLGNIVGTYLGLVCSHWCHIVSGW